MDEHGSVECGLIAGRDERHMCVEGRPQLIFPPVLIPPRLIPILAVCVRDRNRYTNKVPSNRR